MTNPDSARKPADQENAQGLQSARASQKSPIYQQIWYDQTAVSPAQAKADGPQEDQAFVPDVEEVDVKIVLKDEGGQQASGVESRRPSAPNSGGSQPGRQVVLSREGQADE